MSYNNNSSKINSGGGNKMDDLTAQAHAMLEAHLSHNPELLAAARAQMEDQIATSPEAFLKSLDNSPKGKINKSRSNETTSHQYETCTKALDDPIRKLFLERSTSTSVGTSSNMNITFPAVDLAAGSAHFTSQWALRYCEPFCNGSLEWYPTDTNDAIETFTRPCLEYLAQEAEEQQCSPLCTDGNGDDIFSQDRVVLQGLKTVSYNGMEGTVLNKDPKIDGRYAVRLDDETSNKPMSFKAENFARKDDRRSSSSGNERTLLQGLIDRSCCLDLLKREEWPELLLGKLSGKCALVTCTNLLTEIGHQEPTVWKVVMEIASELLFLGGFLLQGDADGWGQFGDSQLVEDHAKTCGLSLHRRFELDAWVLILWEKL